MPDLTQPDQRHRMQLSSRESLLNDCYNTVWAIAESPHCSEFQIGYTHRSGRARHAVYWVTDAYEHFVILADKLCQPDALWLEERLQEAAKGNEQGVAAFSKYHHAKRLDVYRRSSGGVVLDRSQEICSVYMAWRE